MKLDSMEVFVEDFVEVTSMEASMGAFVEAFVEVT